MRRGLLAWSEKETPKAALEARVARVQAAMKAQGFDALLAYTNFPRPATVSYLTHFIPYWNQGLMVMGQEGLPTILVALSNRVRGWALETCHVEDVVCTPRIGADAAKVVKGFADEIKKIGVVDADRVPRRQAEDQERHGDAVVHRGLDHGIAARPGALDHQAVGQFLDLDPAGGQAPGHHGDAVALLDPEFA